jgi:hypothetical protein
MLKFRKPVDSEEEDWADDDLRWMNERDYPDDYQGHSYERAVLVELDGVRCVVKIMAPIEGQTLTIEDALLKL